MSTTNTIIAEVATFPAEAAEHLSTLFRGCEGLVAITRKTGDRWPSAFYRVDELDRAGEEAAAWAVDSDVYVRVSTLTERPVAGRRGNRGMTRELPALVLDIDGAWGIHAEPADGLHPAETAEEALAVLADFPKASRIIASGGGLQAWWFLQDSLDAEMGQRALDRWQAYWRTRFNAAGLHLDNVAELARVMRLPGTLNHKDPTGPRPVGIRG